MHRPLWTDKPTRAGIDRRQEMIAIRAKLLSAGLTGYDVDRRYTLRKGTTTATLQKPNVAGERAIAAALGTKAHFLWPSRYRPSGQRRSPQPQENYAEPPTMRQRQKEAQV